MNYIVYGLTRNGELSSFWDKGNASEVEIIDYH